MFVTREKYARLERLYQHEARRRAEAEQRVDEKDTAILRMQSLVSHFGRHRAHRTTARADFPHPEFGAAVTQAFRPCRPCGGDVPVVLHPGAHTCTEGHVTITQGGQ